MKGVVDVTRPGLVERESQRDDDDQSRVTNATHECCRCRCWNRVCTHSVHIMHIADGRLLLYTVLYAEVMPEDN